MSPGLLIPRIPGIKVRGQEEEPPLVDAPAPDKSKIVVASQFIFQHDLEKAGMMRESDMPERLQGIQIIDQARRGLRMPIKTYGTACVYFMKYRYHVATRGPEEDTSRYDFRDAALASLWTAAKSEETPKKSRDILCAYRNSTLPPEEHLLPEDEMFEGQSKLMINMERYLLEILGFDFRVRIPDELLAALLVELNISENVIKLSMSIVLDIYRTLAVLKQTRQTLALACLEMAARFLEAEEDLAKSMDEAVYKKLDTSRHEIIETLLDLMDLFMNHQPQTVSGPRFNLNDFMRVSMSIRNEQKAKGLARYTYLQEAPPATSPTTSPMHTEAKSTPTLHGTPRTPTTHQDGSKVKDSRKKTSPSGKGNTNVDGVEYVDEREVEIGKPVSPPPSFMLQSPRSRQHSLLDGYGQSPTSPTSPTEAVNPDDPSQVKEVVRFVLDQSRARDEDLMRKPYHNIKTVEVVEQRDLWIPREPVEGGEDVDAPPPPPSASRGRGAGNGYAGTSPNSPPPNGPKRTANGVADVEMRDAHPSGGRPPYRGGGGPPPMPHHAHSSSGLRDDYRRGPPPAMDDHRRPPPEREDWRDRDERDRYRERERRRTPPPMPPSRGYRDERDRGYGGRRW